MTEGALALFEGIGVETELVIADAETLDVRPLADELLRAVSGGESWLEDVEDGPIGLSNELVNHLIELKNAAPVGCFDGLADDFLTCVRRVNVLLAEGFGARLVPSGMHPWMDPARETVLWRHDSSPIYEAFDRLFDCRRHGWANLQSVHLNLSFGDEHEFARLMAAVRLVLPLIPAIAASSPVVEGKATGRLDNRLEFYRRNAERAPSMTADVIPEPIFGADEYRARVLGPIDRDLERLGAERVLFGREWTNARGAIARFDRMAIEIRLIDSQECSRADLSIAAAVGGLVRALVEERWSTHRRQRELPTRPLAELLLRAIEKGPDAELGPRRYAELFGLERSGIRTAGEVWRALVESTFIGARDLEEPVQVVLREGTLAQRILAALGGGFDRRRLREVYGRLGDCLQAGSCFSP